MKRVFKFRREEFEDMYGFQCACYVSDTERGFQLCANGVSEFFDVGKAKRIEFHVDTKQPRGTEYHKLKADTGYQTWYLTDLQRGEGARCPWPLAVDRLLESIFGARHKTLYVWVMA